MSCFCVTTATNIIIPKFIKEEKYMRYKLERKVDGEWYYYGTYNTPEQLARACFELGKMGDCCEDLRITEVS